MRKLLLFICWFTAVDSSAQQLQPEQLKQDFYLLQHALTEAHGGLYRFHSIAEIDNKFSIDRKSLDTPMSVYAFYGKMAKLLAFIGDGHMKIDPDPARMSAQAKPLFFPFQVVCEGEKVFLLTNDTPADLTIRPGMELLQINGQNVAEIRRKILPCLIGDGFITSGKNRSLQRSFSQNYWLFADTSSTFHLQVRDSIGTIHEMKVQGLSNPQRSVNRSNNPINARILKIMHAIDGNNSNYVLNFVEQGTAYLRVKAFTGDHFPQEVDSLFRIISAQKTRTLVLDLRSNGGGMDEWGASLASHFATKPFRYMDHIHARVLIPSFADWKAQPPVDLKKGTKADPKGGYLVQPILNQTLNLQQPASGPFTGRVIVLIDGGTFSAASDFCAVLHSMTRAIFVGEETGGGYYGNTSALNAILLLPNSGFRINIHLWDYWSAVKPAKLKGRGTIPDFPITQKSSDLFKGIDDAYELSLKLSNKSTN